MTIFSSTRLYCSKYFIYILGGYILHDFDYDFDFSTNILEAGAYFTEPATNPERVPIHLATAHNVNDLDDLQKRYDEKGFCYNRYRYPNRSALNRLTAYKPNLTHSII